MEKVNFEELVRGGSMKDMATIPKDFSTAVRDIKLAILQARANAARLANVIAIHHLTSDEFGESTFRHLPSVEIRPLPTDEFRQIPSAEFGIETYRSRTRRLHQS